MDYKEFVEEVIEGLREKCGDGLEIEASRIKKINDTDYAGIIFNKEEEEEVTVSPILHLEPLYDGIHKRRDGCCRVHRVIMEGL